MGKIADFEAFYTPSEASEAIDKPRSRRSELNRRPADYEMQQFINLLQMIRRINGQTSAGRDIQDENTQLSATRTRAACRRGRSQRPLAPIALKEVRVSCMASQIPYLYALLYSGRQSTFPRTPASGTGLRRDEHLRFTRRPWT